MQWIKRLFETVKKIILSSTTVALVDQALVSGGTFLTVSIGARYLSMIDQGKLGYVLSGYLAITIFNMTSIFQTANVNAPKAINKKEYRSLLSQVQILSSCVITAVVTVLIFFLATASGWVPSVIEVCFLALYLLLQQLSDFDRRSAYIFSGSIRALKSSSIVHPLRILLFILTQPNTIQEMLLVMLGTAFLPSFLTVISSNIGKYNPTSLFSFASKHYRSSFWLISSAPFMWLWSYIPVFALGSIQGLAAVGVFTTLRGLTNISNIAMELLETEVSAKAGRLYESNRVGYHKAMRKSFLVGFIVWVSGLFFFILFGKESIGFIFGNQYSAYSYTLLFLWGAQAVNFLFRINAVMLRTSGDTPAIPMGLAIGSIAVAVCITPLVRNFSVNGAATGLIIAALFVLFGQIIGTKIAGKNFVPKKIDVTGERN